MSAAGERLDRRFPELMERLLQAEAICRYRHPELHSLLAEDGADRTEAERILSRMNRALEETGSVHFAIYRGDTPETIDEHIKSYADHEECVHEFFEVLRGSGLCSAPEAGVRFTSAALLDQINGSGALRNRIHRAADRAKKREGSAQIKDEEALRRTLKRLTELGYLAETDQGRSEYVVTGELTLFHAWFELALESQGFDLDADPDEAEGSEEPAERQRDLFNAGP